MNTWDSTQTSRKIQLKCCGSMGNRVSSIESWTECSGLVVKFKISNRYLSCSTKPTTRSSTFTIRNCPPVTIKDKGWLFIEERRLLKVCNSWSQGFLLNCWGSYRLHMIKKLPGRLLNKLMAVSLLLRFHNVAWTRKTKISIMAMSICHKLGLIHTIINRKFCLMPWIFSKSLRLSAKTNPKNKWTLSTWNMELFSL